MSIMSRAPILSQRIAAVANKPTVRNVVSVSHLLSSSVKRQTYLRTEAHLRNSKGRWYSKEVASDTVIQAPQATQKPTPFQQKILVWAKMYPSVEKVPDRVSRGQMKKAMDLFRVRSSICMAALVFVFAAIMALIGRKQRHDGQTMTKIVLEKRQQ